MKPDASRGTGRTPLFKVKELCGQCNDATVFVKDESRNPFGTFKDRRCAALLEKYKGKEQVVFVHITSGNSGYSLGMMAEEERRKTGRDIRVINIVGKGASKFITERLRSCSTVVEMGLSSQIGIGTLREAALRAAGYSGPASNILTVEEYHIANGYSNIIAEIKEEGILPKYIFCPVGGGELLVELADAAKEAWGADAPTIVGVTIEQNVLHHAKEFISNLRKTIADKIATPYSMYKALVRNRIERGEAELMEKRPKEYEIAKEYEFLNRIGIAAEPSAAVAFWGAKRYGLHAEDTAVIINTGKGLYDPSSIHRVFTYKAKSFLKKAGLVAAGAIAAIGIYFASEKYEDYKQMQLIELAGHANLLAENDGWSIPSKEKFTAACSTIPDMDAQKCSDIRSFDLLSERQTRYYLLYNTFDDDFAFRPILPLFREWYTKYPRWMPGEEWPETFETDRNGWPIESTRKPKREFMTTQAECELMKEKGVRLPHSVDMCP